MLVREFMTPNPQVVGPDVPVPEAARMMKQGGFRRLPVVKDGRLVGIVTDRDLKEAMPSDASSLSIWELNYLISKLPVGEVMSKDPITIGENMPLQAAAKLMLEHKIGGLPVVQEGRLVGIVTVSDVLRAYLEREAELLVGAESG
ncbi:MAG: CBS domain-containing protein [Meiothermus sp.]|uniref:CBS domain-containing protein n=2 Tax=Meiothermus sp. TaxID=1955249 RepID=UPI0025D1E393|nr:CBS domain-containing protein [Meiothermus sp.]MCS7057642.1 CBS domain-containing protein [Meiothermus sp.]MCS7193994.1 CBS domain-containing protein [Meiothermus sp.]MCX7740905.1 CBS domain-containing protein [Meiothermus sp.]MDW8090720.1 CBS domain-containing protein [Meiothermus sp.]MDW8480854.1 CBS domain-containing protein [Meiothermus sp.]